MQNAFFDNYFSSEILPPSSLPSHFFICLEKFKNLKKCHATSNYMTRENCERHMIFLCNAWSCGWVTKVKGKWQCDWKCHSCLELLGFWHSLPRSMYYIDCVRLTFLLKHMIAQQIPAISWILLFSAVFICQSLFHCWYFQLLWLLL